ncbi:MAG: Undecaprenyl-diphosphatase [Marmoricola sp.]|nr:Undecaprenyl-diphosphatase [Marmoricola sp.]
MNYLDAIILGIVEGLSEFLPVSSTGHLTIAEKLLGYKIDAHNITAFTAVIQVGAIAAVLIYFWTDIWRIAKAWTVGVFRPEYRGTLDHRMGWYIIVGSIPIGIVGFAARNLVSGSLRSLWVVAAALIIWSGAMILAERRATQQRGETALSLRDALVMGVVQCLALIPGVSRSGASISAGLAQGLDRVTATRMSFYLGIPSLVAAGAYEVHKDGHGLAVGPTIVGTLVAFVVAYASVAWLLRFVAHHSIGKFVPYRVGLGVVLLVLLATKVMSAT